MPRRLRRGAARRAQSGFIVAVVVLAMAAVGLNWAVSALQLSFKKLPVPLAAPLDTLPARLGPWVQVSKDEPLNAEMQSALATDKFIFRDFVDTRIVPQTQIDAFKDLSPRDRKILLTRVQSSRPDAVMNLAVTYYTGLVDTVAHIPDRCYIADGYQPSAYDQPLWDLGPGRLGKKPGEDPRVPVRFINFEDQTGTGKVTREVAYFFHVNGHYENDPLGVRKSLQNLFAKYGYYAKVEAMNVVSDRQTSEQVMTDFLSCAMPEVEKCLPDWSNYGGSSGR